MIMRERHNPYGSYEKYFKRPLDLICAFITLVFFWWLFLIVAVLVRIKIGSPILFQQERPGKDEQIFKLYKFRTMTNETDKNGEFRSDEDRLTKFGKVLRSTSLDELPEIFNIIKGDMSIVGPRPLLIKYLPYYNERQHHRHDVRPGLSGYAQVNGRNAISWDEKFEMDLDYINRITFLGDVKIIVRTVFKVFKREDISPTDTVTMIGFIDYLKQKEKSTAEGIDK